MRESEICGKLMKKQCEISFKCPGALFVGVQVSYGLQENVQHGYFYLW